MTCFISYLIFEDRWARTLCFYSFCLFYVLFCFCLLCRWPCHHHSHPFPNQLIRLSFECALSGIFLKAEKVRRNLVLQVGDAPEKERTFCNKKAMKTSASSYTMPKKKPRIKAGKSTYQFYGN